MDNLQHRCDLSNNFRVFKHFLLHGFNSHLLLVVGFSLNLPLGLQGGDDVLVLPSDLVGEPAEITEFAALPQASHLKLHIYFELRYIW